MADRRLLDVFASAEAWERLTNLKLPPVMAYRLLKYVKQVKAEYDLLKQHEGRLIREHAGVGPSEPARLTPGSPEYQKYVMAFSSVLEAPSGLPACDVTFEALLEALGQESRQVLSVQDLGTLEPFFVSPSSNVLTGGWTASPSTTAVGL